jgi:hypothetical protein
MSTALTLADRLRAPGATPPGSSTAAGSSSHTSGSLAGGTLTGLGLLPSPDGAAPVAASGSLATLFLDHCQGPACKAGLAAMVRPIAATGAGGPALFLDFTFNYLQNTANLQVKYDLQPAHPAQARSPAPLTHTPCNLYIQRILSLCPRPPARCCAVQVVGLVVAPTA